MDKHRNEAIDIAKFICLFLMVFCHIPNVSGRFHEVIYSFHMPFFFFIGGLFFDPNRFSIKKGWQTLLFPYVVFNFIVVILNSCIGTMTHTINLDLIFRYLCGILIGTSVESDCALLPAGPSWFLVAYFLVKVCAKSILKRSIVIRFITIMVSLCTIFLLRKTWSWMFWSMDSAILGYSFFMIAYLVKDKVLRFMDCKKVFKLLPLFISIVCISWINGQADMYACTWGNNPLLYFFFAFAGIATVLLVSKLMSLIPELYHFLKNYVDGAIFIICMNIWLIDYSSLFYRKIFVIEGSFFWYEKVCITMVVFMISLPCIQLLNKIAPALLGKQKKYECAC